MNGIHAEKKNRPRSFVRRMMNTKNKSIKKWICFCVKVCTRSVKFSILVRECCTSGYELKCVIFQIFFSVSNYNTVWTILSVHYLISYFWRKFILIFFFISTSCKVEGICDAIVWHARIVCFVWIVCDSVCDSFTFPSKVHSIQCV